MYFRNFLCPSNYSFEKFRIDNWKRELFILDPFKLTYDKSVLFGENFIDIYGNIYFWKSKEINHLCASDSSHQGRDRVLAGDPNSQRLTFAGKFFGKISTGYLLVSILDPILRNLVTGTLYYLVLVVVPIVVRYRIVITIKTCYW